MDPSALEYRMRRGLDRKDEQMAVLVQRVSGTYYGRYFMPCAAGVGYSHSACQWFLCRWLYERSRQIVPIRIEAQRRWRGCRCGPGPFFPFDD